MNKLNMFFFMLSAEYSRWSIDPEYFFLIHASVAENSESCGFAHTPS